MAKHLNVKNAVESTKRAIRTGLQIAATVVGIAAAIAIPPVAEAVNHIVATFGGDFQISPALVAAVGVLIGTVGTLVAKLQNLIEGRDKVDSVEALLEQVTELRAELEAIGDAAGDVHDELAQPASA